MLVRSATGIVFVAVVLAAMMLCRGSYALLLLAVAVLCSVEYWRIARTRCRRWTGVSYIVLCMVAMWYFPVIGSSMAKVDAGLWSESLVKWPEYSIGWDARIAPAFVAVVWSNDVFAYLVGVTLGSHKMAPSISPKKTWEGFVGGIVGATLVAALVGKFWLGGNLWLWAAFGLVVALASVAGDLSESKLKRAADVKDSGRLLPGHGGALDRFDAMLGAVPPAAAFFIVTHWFE